MPFRFPGRRWRRHHPWGFRRWPRVRPYYPLYINPRPVILDLPRLSVSSTDMMPPERFVRGHILGNRPPRGWAFVPHDRERGMLTHAEAVAAYGQETGKHIVRVGDFWERVDNGPTVFADAPNSGYYPNTNGTYRWLAAHDLPPLPPTLAGYSWAKDGNVWRPFDPQYGAWAVIRREWDVV